MTAEVSTGQRQRIPDDIANAIVQPESYGDEANVTYPAFEWLRKNMPLGQAHVDGYDPLWMVTKYDDIMAVERDPVLFNATANNPILNSQAGDEFIKSLTGGTTRQLDALPFMDPPEHTRIKQATRLTWFTPKNVPTLDDQIRTVARDQVEKLLSFDGECDWADDIALYYPLRIIMSLFGMPEENLPKMLKLTQEFFGTGDPDEKRDDVEITPDQAARQFQAAIMDFFAYFNEFTQERRRNPQDDLMSLIANAELDGEYLPDSFVNGAYLQIATAGHDTTSGTLSGAAIALSRHPDQLEKVRNDHSMIDGLVEESVRWTSPVKHFLRSASEDTTVRDVPIKAGERFMLWYPSGNRDEDYFDKPNAFDIERSPNKHLGFGFGAHRCIGEHIARREMKIFFEELLPHIKTLELTGEPKPLKANFVSSYKSVPIKFTKA